MKIGQMFAKPIDRDMKGVIKVGQDDNLNIQQELEEYEIRHFTDNRGNYVLVHRIWIHTLMKVLHGQKFQVVI